MNPITAPLSQVTIKIGNFEVRPGGMVYVNGEPVLCHGFQIKAGVDLAVSIQLEFYPHETNNN